MSALSTIYYRFYLSFHLLCRLLFLYIYETCLPIYLTSHSHLFPFFSLPFLIIFLQSHDHFYNLPTPPLY